MVPREQGNRRVLLKGKGRCPGPKELANAEFGKLSRVLNNIGGGDRAWAPNSKWSEVDVGTQGQDHGTKNSGPRQGRQLWSKAYLGCLSTLPHDNLFHLLSSPFWQLSLASVPLLFKASSQYFLSQFSISHNHSLSVEQPSKRLKMATISLTLTIERQVYVLIPESGRLCNYPDYGRSDCINLHV